MADSIPKLTTSFQHNTESPQGPLKDKLCHKFLSVVTGTECVKHFVVTMTVNHIMVFSFSGYHVKDISFSNEEKIPDQITVSGHCPKQEDEQRKIELCRVMLIGLSDRQKRL